MPYPEDTLLPDQHMTRLANNTGGLLSIVMCTNGV